MKSEIDFTHDASDSPYIVTAAFESQEEPLSRASKFANYDTVKRFYKNCTDRLDHLGTESITY